MRIVPRKTDFQRWQKCIPLHGDLLFASANRKVLLERLDSPVLSAADAKAQALSIWTLNYRSWYGYALNQAAYCVWVPRGTIETLGDSLQLKIAEEQIRIGVPTLISGKFISAALKKKFPKIQSRYWMTSESLQRLKTAERAAAVEAWFWQNEVLCYESAFPQDLPTGVRKELKRIGVDKLLNRYVGFSGPNCFASAAGAIAGKKNGISVREQWLHWPPFESYLSNTGFKKTSAKTPEVGDILVFLRDRLPVHAAYYLGDGYYFEKPGQDFYEPYRVEKFSDWQSAWPTERLAIWRKKGAS